MWVTILYDGLAFLLCGPLNCELCIYKKKKQTTCVPIGPPGGGEIDVATKSEVAAQILPSWGPREHAEKKWNTLSINAWGDPQPLETGHQNFRRLWRRQLS